MVVAVISVVPYITNKGLHTTLFKIDKPSDCFFLPWSTWIHSQETSLHGHTTMWNHCARRQFFFFTMVSLYLDLQSGQDIWLPHKGAYS